MVARRTSLARSSGPLASWNDGAVRDELLGFVSAVTTPGSDDFVPARDRVAVFDNDGTLWAEQPTFAQAYFLRDRLVELAAADPTLRQDPAVAAVLSGGDAALHALSKRDVVELVARTHGGMSADEFDALARAWFARAKHPRFGRPFPECAYAPMLELLDHLRANGFSIFVVTGGGVDFVRAIAEETYGVPRANVIGSSTRARFVDRAGSSYVEKLPELGRFDDGEAKPENIHLHVGRRPILAFGNSDGDLAMLAYARGGAGQRAAFLLHHDDAEREVAYDRDFRLSPLDRGLEVAAERGFRLVSMKRDFARVFARSEERTTVARRTAARGNEGADDGEAKAIPRSDQHRHP